MALPRKRPLEVYPIDHEGESYFVMRDPEGWIEGTAVVPPLIAIIWDLLDGKRGVEQIQDFIAAQSEGSRVPEETVLKIVEELDRALLLDNDRFAAQRAKITDEFTRATTRPAQFAGNGGYPETRDELEKQLDGFYTGEFGAGLPGDAAPAPLRGIIAPHIDFQRGGPCYTHAYRRITEAEPADLYLVLGVAHASPEPPFVPTTKSYDTPLGPAEIDRDFVEALLKRTHRAGMESEATHRKEHSAEFQAVFLRYARRARPDFTVVPILCSRFDRYCDSASPSTAPQVEEYIAALDETIRACGKRVCIVAGVDFAHVGPRFGHDEPVGQPLIDRMMAGDKQSLAAITEGNAEGFWNSVMADGDWRKVCGLSALYAALRLLGGARATVHRYTYAPDPAGGIVSFAAASFS